MISINGTALAAYLAFGTVVTILIVGSYLIDKDERRHYHAHPWSKKPYWMAKGDERWQGHPMRIWDETIQWLVESWRNFRHDVNDWWWN